ncbi:response regulator [Pleurocapsa sp. PCC 7319]|uniref:response regulator n=1 Tax=Pleurocapsa sp. PCC 7319 TaxID=118161 RepID=UPI001ED9BC6B|nr:response regulator [Pleurocapsa sp. PCC 7319]
MLTKLDVQPINLRPKYKSKFPKPKQVLLLSNTQDLGRIVQLSLEEIASWQVITVDISFQSINQAAIHQPDVLVLDTILPDVAGLDTLQIIHDNSRLKTIPLILLTERMQSSDRKLYASFDVDAAIAKPFDILDLVELINRHS